MRSNTLPAWFGAVATYGAMLGLILGIMAFDFTNNSRRLTVPTDVFIKAMTELPAKANGSPTANLAVLGMFLATLIIGVLIIVLELRRTDVLKSNEHTLAASALVAGISLFVWVAFGTFIAGRLVDFITAQQNSVNGILSIADQLAAFPAYVYVLITVIMIGSAFLLRDEVTSQPVKMMSGGGMSALIVGALIVPVGIAYSNLQPIAADITYKQASPWDQQGSQELIQGTGIQAWDLAIEHYRKAIDLARNEDFYYLWLGRALLEKAKSTTSTAQTRVIADNASFNRVIDNGTDNWNRPTGSDALPSAQLSKEDLFAAAKIILEEARTINPLNTDHSANLARMWRQMADVNAAQADAERAKQPADQAKVTQLQTTARERYDNSSKAYTTATSLSPNNAILWNEWASLYLSPLYKDINVSKTKLDRSVVIDPKFDQTRLLLASWHLEKAATIDKTKNAEGWRSEMDAARKELEQAITINPNAIQAYTQLTQIAIQVNDLPAAISATLALSKKQPNDWNTFKNLAVLYSDTKKIDLAKQYAQQALALAPKEQQASLQVFIQQLSKQ